MAEERCERENRTPRRAVRNDYEKHSMRLRAMEWSRSGERAVSKAHDAASSDEWSRSGECAVSKAHDAASSDGMESKRQMCSAELLCKSLDAP
jgi:hypothetical protein